MSVAPVTVADCVALLDRLAPPDLHESWDNTGLLLGDPAAGVASITTCLTLTPDVAAEAIERGDGLIVAHHPIFFRPVQQLTTNAAEGRMALDLVRAGVAVFSPHARWDNAAGGINERLARGFGLADPRPLRVRKDLTEAIGDDVPRGAGRIGKRKEQVSFAEFVQWVKAVMHLPGVDAVPTERPVRSVGVACGSAGEYLSDAIAAGCDVFVTGEARFHTALEARTAGVGLILVGHYASERFSMEELAKELAGYFPNLPVRPSDVERDPLVRL
ncbi:Nif3-like dinuclear metal center hexameric protein [Alienimonas californiensis]|uniref:GTP cyclohydrolase 1 type 2 homolog n=1 Tax=Alienimonas californiensis TaxID=2527989 RepID=A0A517PE86_9PLAN|nr:Nif3-like dinuclear metal center hexameric protein [Alienimonas californiensis]QDT17694.1 GTP cyclohydrolase 1 type 2 [Alienimonas californiensis]